MRKDVFSDFAVTVLTQLVYKIVESFSSDVESLKLFVGRFDRLLWVRTGKRVLLFTGVQYKTTTPRTLWLERIHAYEGMQSIYNSPTINI